MDDKRKPAPGKKFGAKRPQGAGGRPSGKPFGDRKRAPRAEFAGKREPSREGREGGKTWEKRPRKDYGDKPARKPYGPRKEFGEKSDAPRKPYGPRKEFSDRPRRDYGDKPAPRKEFSDRPRKDFGDKRPPRRFEREEGPRYITAAAGDGWLVGHHAVMAALAAGRRKVREIWLVVEAKGDLATLLAAHPEWPVSLKARTDFDAQFGDMVHQGIAALVGNLPQPSLPDMLSRKPQKLLMLDHVTDPHNLGAVLRSAAAFGVDAVITTHDRAAGVTPTVAKAAAGALETVPLVEVVNLVQSMKMLKEQGFTLIGLAGEGEAALADAAAKGPLCLVVGSEGEGLRRLTRENCDVLARIPISPAVESLNVSVAAGIALYAVTR